MLMGLAAIALVALGVLIAWLLTHRDNSSTQQTGTTVFITTARDDGSVDHSERGSGRREGRARPEGA